MYLEHFHLKQFPFRLTPNTDFFCNLPGYQAALNVLVFSLRQGEGFLKVVGDVGTGKTLLCRILLETLKDEFVTAYIPNPDLTPAGLRAALAQELDIPKPYPDNQHELLELIVQKLLRLHAENKPVALLLDEAQALSFECLEAIRLLTNLETANSKLLQVVLLGQPELDKKLDQPELRQLKQRITFSYYLEGLKASELESYLYHRLVIAGSTNGALFNKKALQLLYRNTKGVPRLINILCHKALLVAYGKGYQQITPKILRRVIKDNKSIKPNKMSEKLILFGVFILVLIAIAITIYRYMTGVL